MSGDPHAGVLGDIDGFGASGFIKCMKILVWLLLIPYDDRNSGKVRAHWL